MIAWKKYKTSQSTDSLNRIIPETFYQLIVIKLDQYYQKIFFVGMM